MEGQNRTKRRPGQQSAARKGTEFEEPTCLQSLCATRPSGWQDPVAVQGFPRRGPCPSELTAHHLLLWVERPCLPRRPGGWEGEELTEKKAGQAELGWAEEAGLG